MRKLLALTLFALPTLCARAQRQPAITAPALSQTVKPGKRATFKVTAANATRLQWYRVPPRYDIGVPIAGATAAKYKTPKLSPADSGAHYFVVVGNAEAETPSAWAGLDVR